jgi:hypothetical protein
MFERSLGDLEMPVQIQANAQNRRKGSTFKFVFKEVETEIGTDVL